jgi:hypothetical protein
MAKLEKSRSHSRLKKELLRDGDIFIYLLSMSHDMGIDLLEAATKKLEESHARYPVEKARIIILPRV